MCYFLSKLHSNTEIIAVKNYTTYKKYYTENYTRTHRYELRPSIIVQNRRGDTHIAMKQVQLQI